MGNSIGEVMDDFSGLRVHIFHTDSFLGRLKKNDEI